MNPKTGELKWRGRIKSAAIVLVVFLSVVLSIYIVSGFYFGLPGFDSLRLRFDPFRPYQPFRHVIHNELAADVLLMEEHASLAIPANGEREVGRPRWVLMLSNRGPMLGKVKFEGDGTVKYSDPPLAIDVEVHPPESWAYTQPGWREFHYRYAESGALSLIPPPQMPATASQPAGFPICLYRIDLNTNCRDGACYASTCGQIPAGRKLEPSK